MGLEHVPMRRSGLIICFDLLAFIIGYWLFDAEYAGTKGSTLSASVSAGLIPFVSMALMLAGWGISPYLLSWRSLEDWPAGLVHPQFGLAPYFSILMPVYCYALIHGPWRLVIWNIGDNVPYTCHFADELA